METNVLDEDGFYGQCRIKLENSAVDGYVLGHVAVRGTAVILGVDEQVFLYTPKASLDPKWPPMQGSRRAVLQINWDGKIALSRLPDLEIICLSEW